MLHHVLLCRTSSFTILFSFTVPHCENVLKIVGILDQEAIFPFKSSFFLQFSSLIIVLPLFIYTTTIHFIYLYISFIYSLVTRSHNQLNHLVTWSNSHSINQLLINVDRREDTFKTILLHFNFLHMFRESTLIVSKLITIQQSSKKL